MRLINLILSIIGSLIFTFIFVLYLYRIDIKKVEKQTKVILGLLMVFSVFQLVSNSIKFSWQSNLIDSELDTLGKSLTAIGLLGLVLMATV